MSSKKKRDYVVFVYVRYKRRGFYMKDAELAQVELQANNPTHARQVALEELRAVLLKTKDRCHFKRLKIKEVFSLTDEGKFHDHDKDRVNRQQATMWLCEGELINMRVHESKQNVSKANSKALVPAKPSKTKATATTSKAFYKDDPFTETILEAVAEHSYTYDRNFNRVSGGDT